MIFLAPFSRCVRVLFIPAFTLFAACMTQANETNLDIRQAIQYTLQNNPQLHQFALKDKTLATQREAAQLSPPLLVELEAENLANTGSEQGASELTLAISSAIELGGNKQARLAVMDAKSEVNFFEKQTRTLDVLGDLTETFIEGLSLQELILISQQEVSLGEATLGSIADRAQRGAGSEAEVLRAQAALVQAELRLHAFNSELKRKKIEISSFWGSESPGFSKFEGDIFNMGSSASFETLAARVKNAPYIEIFASLSRLRNAEIKIAKANSRANLNWRIGVQQFESSGDTALTASFSMPLFSGGRYEHEVAAARIESEQVLLQRMEAASTFHTQLFQAWSLHQQNLESSQKMTDRLIPILQSAFSKTQDAYESGRDRYENLLAIQEQLLAAKRLHILTATEAHKSRVIIEQLTGQALAIQ